jgi:hypothetical protein
MTGDLKYEVEVEWDVRKLAGSRCVMRYSRILDVFGIGTKSTSVLSGSLDTYPVFQYMCSLDGCAVFTTHKLGGTQMRIKRFNRYRRWDSAGGQKEGLERTCAMVLGEDKETEKWQVVARNPYFSAQVNTEDPGDFVSHIRDGRWEVQ